MKSLYARWRQGMRELTPYQLLKAKVTGIIGQLVGLVIASFFLYFSGMGYFLVFILFTIFLLVLEFINTWKQLDKMSVYR